MTQDSVESSVLFSLAELQRMEHDRLAIEERQQATARERRERERRQAEAEQHRHEQEQRASERAATEEHARREAEALAHERARQQSVVEVARIEAEAKVRLAAEERARTQELALLRTRSHQGLYRVCVGLSVALLAALSGMAVGTWRLNSDLDQLKSDLSQAQQLQASTASDRDSTARKFTRARQDWEVQLQAANASVAMCEARAHSETPAPRPLGAVNRPPHAGRTPPPPKCKFEGDPMCDASGQPR
ncbi:MAG TPA: hypothetical protein VHO25_21160 [Polyangiaceae bacterium]|nr:hypothetical protein [Polyangiaceae bacterium]